MNDIDQTEDPTIEESPRRTFGAGPDPFEACPDGGRCGHRCTLVRDETKGENGRYKHPEGRGLPCWRVTHAGPFSDHNGGEWTEKEKIVHERGEDLSDQEEGMLLLGQLLTASMGASFDTMDRLYEMERRRRQALEVHLDVLRECYQVARGGSAREYDEILGERLYMAVDESLADRHQENTRGY